VKRSPKFGRKLLIPLLLLMAIVPVGLAEVVYLFQGNITVYTTSQPLQFVYGSDAPNGAAGTYAKVSLIGGNSVNKYAYGFKATVNITNSSYDLFYQIIGLDVLAPSAYIYVTNVSYTGSSIVNNAWIIIQENPNSYAGAQVIPIIQNSKAVTGASTPVTLTQGTYQVSLLIQPVSGPGLTSSSTASITVYFGDNVISSIGEPLPPGV